jgi:formylmethanofuran dehydrogenase subunit C
MHQLSCFEALEPRTLLAAVHWDGGGGDENWHNPLNWSGDVLPGPGDDVTIDISGEAITVRFSAGSATVASLFSTERLEMEGGALTVSGETTFSGALIMNGGTVTLGGRWAQSGPMEMSGGSILGAGDLVTRGTV